MKNKKLLKRLLSIGCASIIGASLVGCGDVPLGENDNFGWQPDPNFSALDLSERDIYPGGDGMDDNKLTIANWMLDGFNGAQLENSDIYKELRSAAGMNIEAWLLGDGDWQTQLNNAFNTQMLPDMFVSMGPETAKSYRMMIEEGVLLPVSDFVDEDNWPNIYNHLNEYNYLRANLPYANGKHWSVPVKWQCEHAMYVNKAWIRNLNNKIETVLKSEGLTQQEINNLKATDPNLDNQKFNENGPEDILEFYRLTRAFTVCDPDNNGQNDTYGYTNTGKTDLFADCWIFEAFDAGYDRMVDSNGDGTYESSYANENTKKALAFMNKLFAEGILHPAFFEHGLGEKQDQFTTGKVGIIEGHVWYNTILQNYMGAKGVETVTPQIIEQYSNDIGMCAPPKGENGTRGINGNPNFWTVLCLNAGMSTDEVTAALDLLDFLFSPEGEALVTTGPEGMYYSQGSVVSSYPKDEKQFNKSLTLVDGAASINSICNLSAGYLTPLATNADKIQAQMIAAQEYAAYADYPFLQPEAYVEYWDILKDFAQQEFIKIIRDTGITSGSSIPANPQDYSVINSLADGGAFTSRWNSYMDSARSQHLGEVETAYNNAIANGGMMYTK